MRFIVMHKTDAQMEAGGPPPQKIIQEMGAYVQAGIKAGVFKDGAGLHPSSRRVRLNFEGGKRRVTRGPYTGSNELLASMAMIKVASEDEAIAIATRVAEATGDAELEVGPVVEAWDLGLMERPARAPLRFLILRKGDAAFEAGGAPPPGLARVLDELAREDVLVNSARLAPSSGGARHKRAAGKRSWTDGPFTESKELVAGFSIIEVPSLADARRWTEAYADILGDTEVDVREVVEQG